MIGQRALRERYRAFVEAGVDEEIERFYRQAKQFPILGSERFKRDIARRLSKRAMPASAAQEVPEARQLRPVLSLDQITATVARVYRVPVAALLRSQRGRGKANLPRAVALYLARRVAGLPLRQIAEGFQLNHYGSVSGAVTRLQHQMRTDLVLAKQVQRVAKKVINKQT